MHGKINQGVHALPGQATFGVSLAKHCIKKGHEYTMEKTKIDIISGFLGAGKTTFLVKQAMELSENVLITTYTDANEQSIRDKFYEINGCIPSNVTIMPWFSLLIKHGIRPYQSYLINNKVSGVLLVNKADINLLRLKDTNEKKYVRIKNRIKRFK